MHLEMQQTYEGEGDADLLDPRGRECGLLAAVGPLPLARHDHVRRVRRVLEHIVMPAHTRPSGKALVGLHTLSGTEMVIRHAETPDIVGGGKALETHLSALPSSISRTSSRMAISALTKRSSSACKHAQPIMST